MEPLVRRSVFVATAIALALGLAIPSDAKKRKRKKKRPRSVEVRGETAGVSRNFNLKRGRYIATATVIANSSSGGLFFADLYGPRGFMDFLFIENPEFPGTYRFQSVTEAPTDGIYFLDVSEADGPWTIALKPR